MTVTNLIDLAKAIANLPATNGEDSIAEKVAQMIHAKQVTYSKTGDRTYLQIISDNEEYEGLAGAYLRRHKEWKAAMAYAMTMEYYEYSGHITPGAWIRCEALSALMGFDSGYDEDTSIWRLGDLESDRGVFFGSRDQIKVVTMTTETVYTVEEFLEMEL